MLDQQILDLIGTACGVLLLAFVVGQFVRRVRWRCGERREGDER